MMTLGAMLDPKRHRVVAISKDEAVAGAMEEMVREQIGALLVTAGQKPWGIFTKRDLLACLHRNSEKSPQLIKIEDVITGQLMTADVGDSIDTAVAMMVKTEISYLPVIKGGAVTAVIPLNDLMHFKNEALTAEINDLETYIDDLQKAELD